MKQNTESRIQNIKDNLEMILGSLKWLNENKDQMSYDDLKMLSEIDWEEFDKEIIRLVDAVKE